MPFVARHAKESIMISWPYAFLLLAVVAAVFGFTPITGAPLLIARPLAVMFLVLFPTALLYRRVIGARILGR